MCILCDSERSAILHRNVIRVPILIRPIGCKREHGGHSEVNRMGTDPSTEVVLRTSFQKVWLPHLRSMESRQYVHSNPLHKLKLKLFDNGESMFNSVF
jgi:hypothetical protein